jgi:hypothetical protein
MPASAGSGAVAQCDLDTCDVHIGMGVHTANNLRYHRHGCPFLSLQAEGVAHATGTAERDPTELR